MNSKQRVLTALKCGIPDRIPYMYSLVDTELQEQIVGHPLKQYVFRTEIDPGIMVRPGDDVQMKLHYCIHPETAGKLGIDALGLKFAYPFFARARLQRSGHAVEGGLLSSREALKKIRMPDPDQEDVLRESESFVKTYGQTYAVFAAVRLGLSPLLLSMGYDNFAYMLADDREMVGDVLNLYLDYNRRFLKNLEEIGVDFFWAFDDIAFNSGPFFSPAIWDEIFFEPVRSVTKNIGIPWIYHSDGNLEPILDKMLPLGMSGIHPLEPGMMDLTNLKQKYAGKLCLIGNINIDTTLSTGTLQDVDDEVRERIGQLGPGGGYIISDSNSVPYFCKAENIVRMGQAVAKYGSIY